MRGFLRLYEDGAEIKSRLYWCVVRDCYLNFYKDKKSSIPSLVINLEGCDVSVVFNEKYNTNLIQINTQHNQSILLMPENINDFDKWEMCLIGLSLESNQRIRNEKVSSMPRNIRNIDTDEFDVREYQTLPYPAQTKETYSKPPRRKSHDEDQIPSEYLDVSNQRQRFIKQNNGQPRRVESNVRHTYTPNDNEDYNRRPSTPTGIAENKKYSSNQNRIRGISTVKEDPMMSDNEILETKTLDELRKKYPISDKTKRWSIAASDLVGKSNDELFIMLIQLNREKSHMDIWKETLEKQLIKIDEALENQDSDENKEELENSREYIINQLNEMDYMINLAHPLVSFLESVVKMSDVYQGDNQTFHVVYHQHPPSGKEDFSNIDFIRHNQEREVAKLINENQNYSLSIPPNSLKNSLRSDKNSGKENDPELALNLKKSQKFIDRRDQLNEVYEDIECQLMELDLTKNSLEKFMQNLNIDQIDNQNKQKPKLPSKSLVKNVKSQKVNDAKMNDLLMMPRRSTRKAPKSDMIASLNRSEKLNRHNTLMSQPINRGSLYGNNSLKYDKQSSLPKSSKNENLNLQHYDMNYSAPMKYNHSSNSLNEQKFRKISNSSQNFNDYNPESRLQNQLRDLVNGESPSPFRNQKQNNNPEPFNLVDGPLIKLNVRRYQNLNRSGKNDLIENTNYSTDLRNSISNSDISVDSTLIKQRMNLNESFDGHKMWKNPGKTQDQSQFDSPAKLEIKDRYRGSPSNEHNVDSNRSNRIRNQVIKESMARYSENEVGERSEREDMLLKNAVLAQEASRRSRKL